MSWSLFAAALIPLVIGAIWYNPKVLGTAWMNAAGVSEETLNATKGKMPLIFLFAYILGIAMSAILTSLVIHQYSVYGLFAMDIAESAKMQGDYTNFMAEYGDRHRTFGHGAAHGGFISIFLVWPIIAIISMFERRGWKYIGIHFGYWFITLILMGGVVCAWL